MTECKVLVEGAIGTGMVMGDQHELSCSLAIIDAAFQANLSITESWISLLQQEEKKMNQEKAAAQAEILKTKVNFENMDVS